VVAIALGYAHISEFICELLGDDEIKLQFPVVLISRTWAEATLSQMCHHVSDNTITARL
jgi:hypothetical protein